MTVSGGVSGAGRQRGQSLVVAGLLAAALLAAVGVALDAGAGFANERDLQNAADGAALAAAYDLGTSGTEDQATTDAQSVTHLGTKLTPTLTLTFLDSYGRSTTNSSEVVTVSASLTANAPTTFMRAAGINQVTVTNSAQARVPRGSPCGLCVMSTSASPALAASGQGNATVNGSTIMIDSAGSPAVVANGSGVLQASSIGVVGTATQSGGGSYNPAPVTGIPSFPDPLANIPAPILNSPNQGSTSAGSGTVVVSPGVYTTLSASSSGTLSLNAGVYVVTGGVSATGGGSVTGSGVMIYFACSQYPTPCSPGQTGASLSLSGTGTYQVSAPSSGTYQGMGIFYDRNSNAAMTIAGNSSNNLIGSIYAKSGSLTLSGNGASSEVNALVVVNTATFSGNGDITLTFNKSQNYNPGALPTLIQ
ncbi:MAG: pilus assembly protein TadG-related protein [Candidatus Dormibacteria bacterium]